MEDLGSFHIKYLELRLERLKSEPEINQLQIEFLESVIPLAKTSTTYEEYLTKLGDSADFFPQAKAEAIDRSRSLFEIYQELGFSIEVSAYTERIEAIQNTKNYAELASVPRTKKKLDSAQNTQYLLNLVSEFLISVYQIGSEPNETSKKNRASQSKEILQRIQSIESKFNFDILFEAPFARVHSFTKKQISDLKILLETWT